jgi:uncharacterized C2H2 Zn-finger protein
MKGHALERLRIVLVSILLGSVYFTEVYSAQCVSKPRPSATNKCSEEKFQCPQCDKKFSRKRDIPRHVSDVHNKERPFQCDLCKKRFPQRGNLTRHLGTVHGGKNERLPCDQCKRCVGEKSNLKQHQSSCLSTLVCLIEGPCNPLPWQKGESEAEVLEKESEAVYDSDVDLSLPALPIDNDFT